MSQQTLVQRKPKRVKDRKCFVRNCSEKPLFTLHVNGKRFPACEYHRNCFSRYWAEDVNEL